MILRKFIKAERVENCYLHIEAVSDMLPYLAASGHFLCAKSTRLYLQSMLSVQNEYHDVHNNVVEGFHVVKRSNRTWAGLSPDLMIEQVLMRNMKTNEGKRDERAATTDLADDHASLCIYKQIIARADVTVTDEMRMTAKKDVFLAKVNNTKNFINMFSGYLQHIRCQTKHAHGDAGLLIVQRVVQSATTGNTFLVGDSVVFSLVTVQAAARSDVHI